MIKTASLRNHHHELRDIIVAIKHELDAPSIIDKTEIVMQLIHKLFGRLAIHLKLEDSILYPQLIKSPNQQVRDSALRFQQDMEQVKAGLESYKTNWHNPQAIISNPQRFINETQAVLKALEDRITKEETDFYTVIDNFQHV